MGGRRPSALDLFDITEGQAIPKQEIYHAVDS